MQKIEMPKAECLRCGHIWTPRISEVYICPKCKSAKWDVPKKVKTDESGNVPA